MINSSNSKSNNKNNDNKININTTVILVIIKIIRNNIYLEYWSSETDCIYSSIKEKKPAKASIHCIFWLRYEVGNHRYVLDVMSTSIKDMSTQDTLSVWKCMQIIVAKCYLIT